ncbi:MAG: hypothetical protein KGM97_08635 [Alphaproteobacteria bacterium]|nr:hypothetical protein [Alphaproteobacteria bacterium]MDE2631041.1 hypothetical protein [Alphaproteobacteria bacterium]
MFVGYYPSWLDSIPAPSAGGRDTANDAAIASGLALVPLVYSHIVIAFADPNFSWDGDMTSWVGSGLQFHASPAQIECAIETLHARKLRVLLAVGGATYTNWTALAAERRSRSAGPTIKALVHMIDALGLDGLDVDFELGGADDAAVQEYRDAIRALDTAVHLAGRDKLLTLAAWSTGADCTAAAALSPCGGKTSMWVGGRTGRERMTFADLDIVHTLSMVSIMSYDAGYENYDAVKEWTLYRALLPERIVVNIGFEIAPEGWGGGRLVAEDTQAKCPGSIVLADQFGQPVNRPYSVDRLIKTGPLSRPPHGNPQDGIMLWHMLKDGNLPDCGSLPVVSPQGLEAKVASLLNSGPGRAASPSAHTEAALVR